MSNENEISKEEVNDLLELLDEYQEEEENMRTNLVDKTLEVTAQKNHRLKKENEEEQDDQEESI